MVLCTSSSIWKHEPSICLIDIFFFLLVHPGVLGWGPRVQFLGLEPESNFVISRFNSVRPMTDVATNVNGVVSPDGSRKRGGRGCLTKHHASSFDSVQTLPNHGAHWSTGHVGHQTAEEALAGQVSIVLLQMFHRGRHQLHGHQLESLLLEPRDNFTDKSTLDAIRLDHNEGPLCGHGDG